MIGEIPTSVLQRARPGPMMVRMTVLRPDLAAAFQVSSIVDEPSLSVPRFRLSGGTGTV